jgi:ubiquinone biosynthesis protein UbiJ
MPTAQLLHAIAESIINPLLQLDPESQHRMNALNGKRFVVWLDEVPWPIEMAFEQQITFLRSEHHWEQFSQNAGRNECGVKSALATLPELRDSNKISQLIREQKLDICGDMHIAQQVSSLFQKLSIDWEEVLSGYTGDIVAHQVVNGVKQFDQAARRHLTQLADTLGTALIDEKKLAAHRLQVMNFSDQVTDLRNDVERLEMRIARLEQQS